MKFGRALIRGTLQRRYKRFLADVKLEDGREVVAHCANPGAMTGLADAGTPVWVEPNDDPKRKLKFSWKICAFPDVCVFIDTGAANGLVREALENRRIAELSEYSGLRAEVKYGAGSRVDFLLSHEGLRELYLEVKSVSLSRKAGLAEFPDTKTARGVKHLNELADMVRAGHRAMLFYLVARTDCDAVGVAGDIDPDYAKAFLAAQNAGVEVLCYDTDMDEQSITVRRALPFQALEL